MENRPSLGGGNEEERQENSYSSNESTATPKRLVCWDTPRPTAAPDFSLSRAHGSVRTQDTEEQLSDPWLTAEGLYSGIHKMVISALPFDLDKPVALTAPQGVVRSSQPLKPPTHYRWNTSKSHASIVTYDPPLDGHTEHIAAAIRTIGYSALEEVVLVRAMELKIDSPIDPLLLASRLVDGSSNHDDFVIDLSPADSDYEGKLLIGPSPEMLVRRTGDIVEAFPLIRSLPRSWNEEVSWATAHRLANSRRNLDEYAFVVGDIADNLAPLCSSLDVLDSPELMSTVEMQHLAAHIRGRLKDPSLSVLDLALMMHSAPTICDTPTEPAFGIIQAVEADRGFYPGAVGWCDENGDGEFVVSIHCAKTDTEEPVARLWAGGGIVSRSDPEEEVAEINAEMGAIPRVFGVKDAQATAA